MSTSDFNGATEEGQGVLPLKQNYGPNWIKKVAVYCGSTTSNQDHFVIEAFKLGQLLMQSRIGILYGGGNSGLMGAVQYGAVQQAFEEGLGIEEIKQLITGVNLTCFTEGERDQGESDSSITEFSVDSMAIRKAHFVHGGDAAIPLPGSYGTFDEVGDSGMFADLSPVIDPNGFVRPVIFANLFIKDGRGGCYFDPYKAQLENVGRVSFSTPERTNQIYYFADDSDGVMGVIRELNSKPPLLPHELAPKRTPQTVRPYRDVLMNHGLIPRPQG